MRPLPAALVLAAALAGCLGGNGGGPEAGPGGPSDAAEPHAQVPFLSPGFTATYSPVGDTPAGVRFEYRAGEVLDRNANLVAGILGHWNYTSPVEAMGPYGLGHTYGLGRCGEPIWEHQFVEGWDVTHFGALAATAPPLMLVGGLSFTGPGLARNVGDWSVQARGTAPGEVRVEAGPSLDGKMHAVAAWNLTYEAPAVVPVRIEVERGPARFAWVLQDTDAVAAGPCEAGEPSEPLPTVGMGRWPTQDPPTAVSLIETVQAALRDVTIWQFQQFQMDHPDAFLGNWYYLAPPAVAPGDEGWMLFFTYPGGAERFILECREASDPDGPVYDADCTVRDRLFDPEDPSPHPDWATWEMVSYAALGERLAPVLGRPVDVLHTHIDRNGNITVDIGWRDPVVVQAGTLLPYHAVAVDAREGHIQSMRGLLPWT